MTIRPSRRAFLRSLGGLVASLGGGVVSMGVTACSRNDGGGSVSEASATEEGGGPHVIHRPLVRPASVDEVWIATPLDERPAAYVDMATRQVFVDRHHRDRASWLLDAHISVSTGLWRIPLPGDSPRMPIAPGDERREFEELDIGAWAPGGTPHAGDVRIVLGRRTPTLIPAGCLPVQGTTDWLALEPLRHDRCLPGGDEAIREDFLHLGRGRRYADRGCTDRGVDVPVLGWACRS